MQGCNPQDCATAVDEREFFLMYPVATARILGRFRGHIRGAFCSASYVSTYLKKWALPVYLFTESRVLLVVEVFNH